MKKGKKQSRGGKKSKDSEVLSSLISVLSNAFFLEFKTSAGKLNTLVVVMLLLITVLSMIKSTVEIVASALLKIFANSAGYDFADVSVLGMLLITIFVAAACVTLLFFIEDKCHGKKHKGNSTDDSNKE